MEKTSDYVPDELLLKIFIRISDLPSLIQCTTVCKIWYSLITQNQFIPNFVQLLNHKPRRRYNNENDDDEIIMPYTILFRNKMRCTYFPKQFYQVYSGESKIIHEDIMKQKHTYDTDDERHWPWECGCLSEIRATFHDMLLVMSACFEREFYICNPLTKKRINLPYPPLSNSRLVCLYGLVAKPKIEYDHGANNIDELYNYKVVILEHSCYRNRDMVRVLTFCSNTREWSSYTFSYSSLSPTNWGSIENDESFSIKEPVTSSKGNIYWLLTIGNYMGVYKVKGIISCNPFREETDPKRLRFIEFPKGCVETHGVNYRKRICIGIVRGRLRLSLIKSDGVGFFRLRIWEFDDDDDDDGELWCLVHDVRIRKTVKMNQTFVLAFHPNNPNVIFLSLKYRLYIYEVKEDKYRFHGRFPKLTHYKYVMKNNLHNCLGVFTLLHPPSSIPKPPHPSPWYMH
ncbi:hypothetical protein F8388_025371 [Cannabis sativa]|uniref:F-box domain-containing protein n=1 Tax=Cannabis sativa TaxID=3483 RepID=A0A7J6G343_CANSA|nr:hypothetical protein F8388_025371 [Cannabis sativa]